MFEIYSGMLSKNAKSKEISVYTLKRGDKFKMNPEDQTECEFLGIFGDRWCFTGRGGDDFYLLRQRKTVFSC